MNYLFVPSVMRHLRTAPSAGGAGASCSILLASCLEGSGMFGIMAPAPALLEPRGGHRGVTALTLRERVEKTSEQGQGTRTVLSLPLRNPCACRAVAVACSPRCFGFVINPAL